jgi:nicotinamide N-methyltransferase
LWNASKVLADYFDSHPDQVRGKRILEMGAGGALPSLVAACNAAEKVINTTTL